MRPSIGATMHHEFMTRGLLPPHLPASHGGFQQRLGLNGQETRVAEKRRLKRIGTASPIEKAYTGTAARN
ncbi:hypothetical protein V5799_030292 [Amblyomma americanum]|uniref:Uncharacterized protein n=1 Tax=Amblyomma americanum TaxID=6943 RepID=A0AAQ4ENK1_AMBAM